MILAPQFFDSLDWPNCRPTRSTALFSVSKRSGASPDNLRSFFFKPNFRSSAFRSCFYKRISITWVNIWLYRFVCLPWLQLVDCLHCSNQAWREKYCIGLCSVPFLRLHQLKGWFFGSYLETFKLNTWSADDVPESKLLQLLPIVTSLSLLECFFFKRVLLQPPKEVKV